MYNHGNTQHTIVKDIKKPDDDDSEDSVLSYIPLLLLDLKAPIERFRLDCCDTVLAESFNDDCEELEIIMPYIRYVKHNFMTKETGPDYDRGVPGYIMTDLRDMFAANGEEQAEIIAKAHKDLADRVLQAFINTGFIDEGGMIPYTFVKRISPDAFLFATYTATITSATGEDEQATPLVPSTLKVRQSNPDRYKDIIELMVQSKMKREAEKAKPVEE